MLVINTHSFGRFWPVSWAITHSLGPRSDFHNGRTPGCVYVSVINTHIFGRFMSVSCTITQRFGDPEGFPRLMNPGGAFMCRSSTLTILVNSGRLVNYYSLFWGPGVVSMIDDPRGASTCRSSTLAVFVDSDPFRGLLFTVLGSQSDFHGCRIPRCAYVLLVKTRSLGRFWPVSWTTTLFWGLRVILMIDEPLVRLRFGHQRS